MSFIKLAGYLYYTLLYCIILYLFLENLIDLNFLQSFPGFWRWMSLAVIFISLISSRSFTFPIYFSDGFCIVSFYPFNLGFQMHWHILLKYLWGVFVSAVPLRPHPFCVILTFSPSSYFFPYADLWKAGSLLFLKNQTLVVSLF